MIPRLLVALSMLAFACPAGADTVQPVHVSAGRIVDLGVLTSKYAGPRRVVVWLPPHYKAHGPKYAVLYMHDGQNLFDKATAGFGMEWEVDEHLSKLIAKHQVLPTIVVGIWNTPKRLQEYVPSKPFEKLPAAYQDKVPAIYGGKPLSDGYLKFMVRELRPMIDRRFNVSTNRADTVIMGSSMGSIISLYAINEYPQIFGGAGMMSTHWPRFTTPEEYAVVSSAFERYLAPALPDPRTHRMYFDHGTEMLDDGYARYQRRIDAVVARRGYKQGVNWLTRNFPGQEHNEISWASRIEIPLRFLLPPR